MLHLIWSRSGADLSGSGWDGMGAWRRDTSEYTLFMACHSVHAQLHSGSLFSWHTLPPLVDYIYITATKPKTMMDCLEAWFCHLGCWFDTLAISSFQSLLQPWISLNLGICPQTLSLVAKVYASDFTPASLELGGRNHFFWGAHPNAVFRTRQHSVWLTAGTFLKGRKK